MKVLLVAYDKNSSGIASYTIELAKLLSSHVNLTLLSFNEIKGISFKVINIDLKAKSRALPLYTFLKNKNTLKEIETQFDIVHETLTPWGSPSNIFITTKWGYVGYFRLALIRQFGLSFPENLGAFPVTFQHYIMDSLSFKKAKYIISINQEGDNFVPPPVEIRPRKKYECDSNKLRLLFISRDLFMKRKNLQVVLASLKYVKKPVELHLVGNPRGKKIESENIVIHGYLPRDKVIELMYNVDLLLLPSTYEELGYVGLEAYSIGLPVITSDIPSFNAVFKASPKFLPQDPIALAKILNELTCEKIEEFGVKSHELAKEYNKIAEKKILEIYKNILS